MIKAQMVLYAVLVDKRIERLDILSEHPEHFEPCYNWISTDIDFHSQVVKLFSKYFDLDYSYVNFIPLEPIIDNEILTIPIYCLVPYSISLKEGYFISPAYASHIPTVRQLLNII